MKLVRLIKICSNEAYNEVRIGKYLSDAFSTPNGLKQYALSSLTFSFVLEYAIRKGVENQGGNE
jgi:hypothetical protein